jgi:Ni/Co efflux regulator RcnB
MRKFLFATMIVAVLAGCQTTPSTDTGAPIDDKTAAPTRRHDQRRRRRPRHRHHHGQRHGQQRCRPC